MQENSWKRGKHNYRKMRERSAGKKASRISKEVLSGEKERKREDKKAVGWTGKKEGG